MVVVVFAVVVVASSWRCLVAVVVCQIVCVATAVVEVVSVFVDAVVVFVDAVVAEVVVVCKVVSGASSMELHP